VQRCDLRLRRVDGSLKICRTRTVLDLKELSDHVALSIIF